MFTNVCNVYPKCSNDFVRDHQGAIDRRTGWVGKEFCVVCRCLLVGTLRQSDLFEHVISIVLYLRKSHNFIGCWEPCRTCACARMMARNMTFGLLDHVIKVTFEQRTENNAIVYVLLSPVKVPSIAALTVIYIVYKLSINSIKCILKQKGFCCLFCHNDIYPDSQCRICFML